MSSGIVMFSCIKTYFTYPLCEGSWGSGSQFAVDFQGFPKESLGLKCFNNCSRRGIVPLSFLNILQNISNHMDVKILLLDSRKKIVPQCVVLGFLVHTRAWHDVPQIFSSWLQIYVPTYLLTYLPPS